MSGPTTTDGGPIADRSIDDDAGSIPSDPQAAEFLGSGDWRDETLARVRALIARADPEAVEDRKWGGVPVWSHDGILCTGERYKEHVKLTFAQGASLSDPAGLFNSSLEGRVRRAIDIREGEVIDEDALAALVRVAAAHNAQSRAAARARKTSKRA